LAAMAPGLAPRAAKAKLATMPTNSLDDGLSVVTALAKEIRRGVKRDTGL
jgi:hypothetical protein